MLSHDEKVKLARAVDTEELWQFVRDPSPEVVLSSSSNKNLTEDMAVFIAKKKSSTAEILGLLASDVRFKGSYKLKLAVCKNPNSPLKIVLSLLKFLRIFDLGDITKNQSIPINIRQKIEYSIMEKMTALPPGVKVALARRSSINVITSLMGKGDRNVITSCLESPLMTEDHLCAMLYKFSSNSILMKTVAEHPQWSLRYRVRFALVRNYYTPMTYVTTFIQTLKTADLRELYSDTSLPSSTKPYIFNELALRDESVEIPQEETYHLSGDEDSDFTDRDRQP